MAGLILAGIGKGIADAGAAYAGGMSKMAEFEMQQEREAQREQRQLRLADQLETQKSEKYATKSNEVAAAADIAPTKRAALEAISKLKEISPDPSQVASEEEMTQYMKENPSYKQGLEKSGLIGADKMDPRLRRATDEEAAARSVGAPASMIESLSKAKRDTLSLLSQEWKESQGERRLDIMEKGAVARQAASDAKAKNAGADKPITGVDLERTAKAAERALALQLGVPLKDVPETVARLKKNSKIDADTQGYLDEYQSALKDWQGYKRKPKASGDNTPTPTTTPPASRPPLGSFVRP